MFEGNLDAAEVNAARQQPVLAGSRELLRRACIALLVLVKGLALAHSLARSVGRSSLAA